MKGRSLGFILASVAVLACVSQALAQKDSPLDRIGNILPIYSPAVGLENETDRPGMDYQSFDIVSPDPKVCQAACATDPRCRAFTYVKPGVQGRSARCWLKSGVPAAVRNNCCVSGVNTGASVGRAYTSQAVVGSPGSSAPARTGRAYTSQQYPGITSSQPPGKEELLEELVIPNTRPEKILSRTVLEMGREYVIEASGTFDDWGNTPHGIDAVWCFAEWRCGRQGQAWNQLIINGKGMTEIAGQTIPYDSQHVYRIKYRGQGNRVEFYMIDAQNSWQDNLGAVTVRIYGSGGGPSTGSAAPRDLTGRWRGNDGGSYYLRQAGSQLWWYGQSGDNGTAWSNVFHGRIQGNQVIGDWVDVPHGRNMNRGEMLLQILGPNQLRAVHKTGGFGGSEWTR